MSLHVRGRGPCHLTQAVESSHSVHHPAADGVVCQGVKHTAQGAGTSRSANQVLQDQVPADEKCHKLPNGDIAVGVGRSCGLGDSNSKLCIAHTYKGQRKQVVGFWK